MRLVHNLVFLSLLLMGITIPLAMPALAREKIKPSPDVYLTFRRVCRACHLEEVGNQKVRLTNSKGHSVVVYAHEILGVDEHPVQRKVLDHFLHHLHPISMDVLLPEEHYGGEHELYGRPHNKPNPAWWSE
jgi:hypothetical protein